jgi:hypothetical protein
MRYARFCQTMINDSLERVHAVSRGRVIRTEKLLLVRAYRGERHVNREHHAPKCTVVRQRDAGKTFKVHTEHPGKITRNSYRPSFQQRRRRWRAISVLTVSLDLTRFDGHLTSPTLRAEVFDEITKAEGCAAT